MRKSIRWFSTEEHERRLLKSRSPSPYRRKRTVSELQDTTFDEELTMAGKDSSEEMPTLKDLMRVVTKISNDVESVQVTMSELKGEIHLLHMEKETMKREIEELRSQNDFLHNKVDLMETKLNRALEQSHHNSQYSRRNNLRFFGVKETKEENVLAIITDIIVNKLKIVDFTPNEIDAAHRVGPYSDPDSDPKPRGIIVRFVRRIMRDRIVKNRKVLAGTRMAITEDLTKQNTQLLKAVAAHDKVEKAWPQDGRVMVCITNSKKIASVSSMADLNANVDKWSRWKKKITTQSTQQTTNVETTTASQAAQSTESMDISQSK